MILHPDVSSVAHMVESIHLVGLVKSPSNGLQLHLYVISEKLGLEEEIGGHHKKHQSSSKW